MVMVMKFSIVRPDKNLLNLLKNIYWLFFYFFMFLNVTIAGGLEQKKETLTNEKRNNFNELIQKDKRFILISNSDY